MRVSVSVGVARAHAYSFSDYLRRTSQLGCFYIAIPRALVDQALRPFARTFPWLHIPLRAMDRIGIGGVAERFEWQAAEAFDRWVGRNIEPCDVFMAMSGQGLHARRAAKRIGALAVCDRGSSHILYQDRILAEEFALHGLRYPSIDPRVVEKECQEYAEADLIVVQSSFALRTFIANGMGPEKVACVPLGVDRRQFRPVAKADDVFRVLYVGQLSLRKGLPYLLKAVAGLRLPKFELMLIGTISQEARPFLAQYEGLYRYLGPVAKAQLYSYYSQASVLAMPTIEDGFGLALGEALACGIPIITTPHSGGPDLITDGIEGFIVPIRDAEAVRERVLQLYRQPAMRDGMVRAALARVEALRGWDEHGSQVVELYRQRLRAR